MKIKELFPPFVWLFRCCCENMREVSFVCFSPLRMVHWCGRRCPNLGWIGLTPFCKRKRNSAVTSRACSFIYIELRQQRSRQSGLRRPSWRLRRRPILAPSEEHAVGAPSRFRSVALYVSEKAQWRVYFNGKILFIVWIKVCDELKQMPFPVIHQRPW